MKKYMAEIVTAVLLALASTIAVPSSYCQAAEMKLHHFLGEFNADAGALKYRGAWWLNIYSDNSVKIQGWHKGYVFGQKVIDQKGGKVFAEARIGESFEHEYGVGDATIHTKVTLENIAENSATFQIVMRVSYKGVRAQLVRKTVAVKW